MYFYLRAKLREPNNIIVIVRVMAIILILSAIDYALKDDFWGVLMAGGASINMLAAPFTPSRFTESIRSFSDLIKFGDEFNPIIGLVEYVGIAICLFGVIGKFIE